jgi:hypothetical protein
MYCFYLFGEGGRFGYPGFRFGCFMFGNIAAQILGYYAIAAVLLPLGYGHLGRRRWVRPLALALIGFWWMMGLPFSLVFLAVLLASKEVTLAGVVVVIGFLAASYLVLPWLLRRLYRSRDLRLTLEAHDPNEHRLERTPVPVLTLCLLYLSYLVALHIPILLNGLYPLFGTFLSGLPGIAALDLSILALGFLTWGTFEQRAWAWWGGLAYWGLLAVSTAISFAVSSYPELLAILDFPPRELEFLDGVPLQGIHLTAFFALPMLILLGYLVASRRHFGAKARTG